MVAEEEEKACLLYDHNSPPYGKAAYMHVSSKCRPVGNPILHMKRCAYMWPLLHCHQAHLQKDSRKEADLCKGFFALYRDCIKGRNLATHADMIGVNVSALLHPIAFNMTKVKPISYHSLPWYDLMQYNIIPRHRPLFLFIHSPLNLVRGNEYEAFALGSMNGNLRP
jgi:hypothetical protein